MKEIVEKRERYSKHYNLGNGKVRTEITAYPVHYKGESGQWEDIDTSIKDYQGWEFSKAVLSNTYRAYFQDLTEENSHLVGVEFFESGRELWMNMKLQGAKPSDVVSEENRVTFTEVFPDIDVEYVVLPDMLKENMILKKKTPMRFFTYTLKTGGVTPILRDGEYLIVDQDNNVIWNLGAPYMEDSEGNISYGVEYDLTSGDEYVELRVNVTDEQFLEEAAYPIVIDPTLSTPDGEGLIDTYVDQSVPNNNLSGSSTLSVKAKYPSSPQYLSYLLFMIKYDELFSKDVEVTKAELNLWGVSALYGVSSMDLFPLTRSWDVKTASWNNRPSFGTVIKSVSGSLGTSVNRWVKVQLINYVKGANFKNGFGFALGSDRCTASGWNGTYNFASTRYSDVTKRPSLIIEYLVKPTLGFHSGNPSSDGYYSDNQGTVFKYLDFGTLTAGQTSLPKRVYLRNLTSFNVRDVSIRVSRAEMPEGVFLEISKYNNPFIAEEYISFEGVLPVNEDIPFYARIATTEEANTGWNFTIRAKAIPHDF